jgi:stage II sporulation protein D
MTRDFFVKTYIKTIAVIFIFAAFLPLISLIFLPRQSPTDYEDKQTTVIASETAALYLTEYDTDTELHFVPLEEAKTPVYSGDFEYIKMYDINTGKTSKIPLEEYVAGAVIHEMPYTFEAEALKAQAVAARTYAVRKILENRENPQNNQNKIDGADVSNDFAVFQGYYSEAEAKAFYKELYDGAKAKIERAVSDTAGYIIVSGDEPIVAAFHSMSGGMTEYSANIWQIQLPYLVPVISDEDTEEVPLETVYTFTEEEIRSRLLSEIEGISLSVSPVNWLSIEKVSESGTVLVLRAGDRLISGEDFREIFTLRSAVFDFEYFPAEAAFRVTTKGYGHGVGMSQYGANGMAKDGFLWEEIVLHYYTGAQIAIYNLKR